MANKKDFTVAFKVDKADMEDVLDVLGLDAEDVYFIGDDEEDIEKLFGNLPTFSDEEDEDCEEDLPFGLDDAEWLERQVDTLENIIREKNARIDRLNTTIDALAERLSKANHELEKLC